VAIVEVRVFASLRQHVAPGLTTNTQEPFHLAFHEGQTLRDLMKVIGIPEDAVTISLVNGLRQPLDYMLKDGDRVGLFPPLGGG